MRVLEHCLPSANAEMQAQINALRQAFSADVNQPFELKPTLGLRSPTMENHPTPSSTNSDPVRPPGLDQPSWTLTGPDPVTPETTAAYATSFDGGSAPSVPHHSSAYEVPQPSSYTSATIPQASSQTGYSLEPVISNEQHTPVWDPSGIFHQWNAAFGGEAPPQATPPGPRGMPPTSARMLSNQTSPINTHSLFSAPQVPMGPNHILPDSTPPAMPMVTPVMWQDAFTSAYVSGHGQKRYREASVDHSAYEHQYHTPKRRG
jgi:hypothetical protein